MNKFTHIERLKNELRSYEEAQWDDNVVPRFQPNPADVRQLIKDYEMLAKTLETVNKLSDR